MFKKVKINYLSMLIFTFFISFCLPNNFNKCIWIKSDSMKNKESIEDALIFAYEYGFDTVFLQVRYRGDAFYDSDIVPKHNLVSNNFDPLKYAITLGQSLGLEIHAWANTYILWSANYKPTNLKHLYYTNPEWTESNIYGKSDSEIDISIPQSRNWEGVYLSPNHPEVNIYLKKVFVELIEKYDLDGLHLDYIRFQDDIYGYNEVGKENFITEYGFDPIDIERGIISTKYGWEKAEIDAMKNDWKDYKTMNITNLVYSILSYIDNSDKEIKLSAAVKNDPVLSVEKWSQDWISWLNNDIIDFVVVMNYSPDLIDFYSKIEDIRSEVNSDNFDKIIMGISVYNQDASSVSNKINVSHLYRFKGISLFSYDNKKDNIYWFDSILDVFEKID